MKLSVFTPTHDPKYLHEVWATLRVQTHADWEWVVVPNGERRDAIRDAVDAMTQNSVPAGASVRIVVAPQHIAGIGALKRFACEQCCGFAYVELDHDDLLAEDCLAEIAKAIELTGPNAFIYSQTATVRFDGTPVLFTPDFGWKRAVGVCLGKTYTYNACPPVTARTISEILFAPDHVRVWTAEAYRRAGGHDPAFPVADDHDLIVRTYLAGTTFHKIDKLLYLHRVDENNTSTHRVAEIGTRSRATRDKHLHALAAEWCRREHLNMFDLGGAHDCPSGYIPIDTSLPEGSFGRGDVFEVLESLADNSVGVVRAADFLEHVPTGRIVELMNLVYRKLVPGGLFLTLTPAVCDNEGRTGRGAFQDPTHVSFWSSNNFWYYTDHSFAKYVPGIACRFQTVVVENFYPTPFYRQHLAPYVRWDGMALKRDGDNDLMGQKKI